MNTPEFEKFSLEDLRSSLASIDKEKYPERFERLLKALAEKEKQPPEPKKQDTWRVNWKKNPQAGFEPIKKFRLGYSIIFVGLFSLLALSGLFTGKLWFPGKSGLVIEGAWARLISAIYLIITARLFYMDLGKNKSPENENFK